jgi:hypothetical protein
MRRGGLVPALLVLAAAAALPAPAPAAAQIVIFDSTGSQPLTALESSVKASGTVSVDFHGDEAAGCAERHLCGVSGTVTWDPGRGGALVAFGYRSGGVHMEDGFLSLGDELGFGGTAVTSARVRRATGDGSAALCADVGPSLSTSDAGPRPGSSVAVSLFGSGEVLRTRCAGPLATDVSSLLPARTISEQALRRGKTRLDFTADGQFAAHGLAGTLHSDVVLKLSKAQNLLSGSQDESPPGTRRQRQRYVQVSYRVESVSGQIVTSVHGLADPDLCGPLDSCGLLGSITTAPTASAGEGYLLAYAPAKKHTKRDLLRALGLAPGPRPHGVRVFGSLSWDRDGGSVTSELTRAGEAACTDSSPLAGGGTIDLSFSAARVSAAYYGSYLLAGGDPLRTRCPGPGAADAGAERGLARGTLPLRALAHRRVTLRLTRGGDFGADGYRGSTRADLTVVVRRTRIRHQVRVESVPTLKQMLARRLP